jgi:hypothetical protein
MSKGRETPEHGSACGIAGKCMHLVFTVRLEIRWLRLSPLRSGCWLLDIQDHTRANIFLDGVSLAHMSETINCKKFYERHSCSVQAERFADWLAARVSEKFIKLAGIAHSPSALNAEQIEILCS